MKKISLIFLSSIVLLASCSNQNTENWNKLTQNEINRDSFELPRKVVIADLPDSLQPKNILKEDIKTITAVIPQKGKAPFVYTDPNGEVHRETLEPPVTKLLPVLRDENGEPVLDKNDEPFIMGEGGISQFSNYTVNDGLALDIVMCSTLDTSGNLWFGTPGAGVSCYDGNSFITYTTAQGLSNNSVRSILADKKGNIWIGTDNAGVCRFDGKKFTTFTTEQGLSGNDVRLIFEDKSGNLWFCTNDHDITFFDGKVFIPYFLNYTNGAYFRNLFEDPAGNICSFVQGGIVQFNGNSFNKVIDIPYLRTIPVISVTEDRLGNFWVGTANGLYHYNSFEDLKEGNYNHYTIQQGLGDNFVLGCVEDGGGDIWVETNAGISKYEPNTNTQGVRFISFSKSQGFANGRVRSSTEDKAGGIWFSTYGAGISRYDGKGFTTFSSTQGLPSNDIRTITEDHKGNLWFGTNGGGISRFDGYGFTNYTGNQGLFNLTVKGIFEDKAGNLWFGSQNVLNRYEPSINGQPEKIITYFNQGLFGLYWDIIQDQKGSMWFARQLGGVCRYDDNGFTFHSTQQGLASNDVRSIAEDIHGNFWFGTFGKGVSYFDGESFTSFSMEQGLSNNFILCITADKSGNLWIGTQDGLNFLSKGKIQELLKSATISGPWHSKNTKNLFKEFTVADGLPDNYISQIVELPNGKMAVGSNRGIVLFDQPSAGIDEFDTLSGLEIYNSSTGYPVQNVSVGQNGMFLDSKGILWAGTGSDETSLVRFDFASLQKKTKPLEVTFKQVTINEDNICWNDLAPGRNALPKSDSLSFPRNITEEVSTFGRALKESEREEMRKRYVGVRFDDITPFYPVPVNLVLPFKHNTITIHYAANELAKPNLVQYQYFLDGYNNEWSPVLKNTYATFGNIKEGVYTFKVRARYTSVAENGAGNWSEIVSYQFRVLPPWYRSWLAYLVYGILFLAAVWQINIFQKKRTLRIEREKTQKKELEQAKEIEKAYTKLKSTQSQLIQSEKMASLGELTAGIAHEIQNPLNFVNNFSEVNKELLDELKDEIRKRKHGRCEPIADDVIRNEEKINHHGKRADAIVKGMLQHSRSSSGVKEPTDINALADEYLRLSYHGLRAKDKSFNATMKTDFDETIGNINIIPQDIGRVVLNLINNAFYVVDEKKTLRQAQGDSYEPTVSVSTKKINDKVEIKVKDNGNGIPQKVLDKIFQPFFTTKPTGQGTGLGLSLSYDIVKAHGGEIKVETKEGEGTEFIIQLPVV